MSNHSNEANDQDVVARLVRHAVSTHRSGQPEARKTPRYPSEETRSKVTLDLDPDTIAALRSISEDFGTKKRVSAVAQALLDFALDGYWTGRLQMKFRPTALGYGFELVEVPEEEDERPESGQIPPSRRS